MFLLRKKVIKVPTLHYEGQSMILGKNTKQHFYYQNSIKLKIKILVNLRCKSNNYIDLNIMQTSSVDSKSVIITFIAIRSTRLKPMVILSFMYNFLKRQSLFVFIISFKVTPPNKRDVYAVVWLTTVFNIIQKSLNKIIFVYPKRLIFALN